MFKAGNKPAIFTGIDGITEWRLFWTDFLLNGLTSESLKMRSNIANYVLPVILEVDELGLGYLVEKVLELDCSQGKLVPFGTAPNTIRCHGLY